METVRSPDWMTGNEREQAERDRIKDGVRLNRRQQRRDEKLQRAREAKAVGKSTWSPPISSPRQRCPRGCPPLPPIRSLISSSTTSPDSPFSIMTIGSNKDPSIFGQFGSRREAELLMHYFDHVSVLQFRFHTPSVQAVGRRWILRLLTETKSLYYAALSLSALHQHAALGRVASEEVLNELHQHHNQTLKELQISLQSTANSDLGGGIYKQLQVLAFGVSLLSRVASANGNYIFAP